MTSQANGPGIDDPLASPPPPLPSLDVRRTRSPTRDESPETDPSASSTPTHSLPIRAQSPPSIISRSSTLSGVLSRSSSPNGRLSLSLSRFGRQSSASPLSNVADSNDETRSLIVRSFSPVVAVYASPEADALALEKGFDQGFTSLLQPYGEHVTGKVVVRDSVGASRSWEDFGVRFQDLKNLIQDGAASSGVQLLDNLEELVDQYMEQNTGEEVQGGSGLSEISPYYRLLLSRLLSSQTLSQHEAFMHPVAAVVAITSSTPSPIESLRNLYSQTAQGAYAMPPFANPEYLRYYLLIHDDDRDDYNQTSALFDQMKRHFGLHCHLLRLKSAPVPHQIHGGAREAVEFVPHREWLSTSAELTHLQATTQLLDLDEDSNAPPQLFVSDATAIRVFVRELVAQSIVPYMEQRISLWNEQIASRRRGISGRFMSLSKRWGGISSLGSSRSSTPTSNSSTSSGNYDSLQSHYRWDAPESLLRKMADFAMMLRDYKLAASTYELLRSDYSNDKAWKYLAGVSEMSAVATLLNPLLSNSGASTSSSKSLPKLETFDALLEAASYSYLSRCNEPALALRSILLGVELLKVRGRLAAELGAKWAIRILDLNLIPPSTNTHVLISERVASCFTSNHHRTTTTTTTTTHGPLLTTRRRKAALWLITSADEWMKLGRAQYASARLNEALELHAELQHAASIASFTEMAEFISELQLAVRLKLGQARRRGASGASATGRLVEPEHAHRTSEAFGEDDDEDVPEHLQADTVVEHIDRKGVGVGRGHKRAPTNSLIPVTPIDGPVSPIRGRSDQGRDPLGVGTVDDGFE